MSVSKVTVLEGCILCGICEQLCPEVFEMAADTTFIKAGADLNQNEKCIRESSSSCPVAVIEVND